LATEGVVAVTRKGAARSSFARAGNDADEEEEAEEEEGEATVSLVGAMVVVTLAAVDS
jgi:hypothetical protein